jgi:putative transposase
MYHVCNRGSRKGVLFENSDDYDAFECLMNEARAKRPIRILAYHLMPNHFHFLLWPVGDDDVPRFMQWLTSTHASRWHRERNTVGNGAVYQGRYRCVWIENEMHLFNTWRYIERNAREAGFVERVEEWRWSSASTRNGDRPFIVDPLPFARPSNWLGLLNGS